MARKLRNERFFRGGWYHPGDEGRLLPGGMLQIMGRSDDQISAAGRKFYPAETENALLAHPGVIDAVVLGYPHPEHGEVAVACLVITGPHILEELRDFCQARLANYKCPAVWLTFNALPKSRVGKPGVHRVRVDGRGHTVRARRLSQPDQPDRNRCVSAADPAAGTPA